MENSGIRIEKGAVSVDSVAPHKFKDTIDSAQIRQTIKKIYPSSTVGNNKADSLFELGEFGLEDGNEYESSRVTWLDVPKGTTAEQVKAMLAKFPDACIYQEIGHTVVLTSNQEQALESGLTTLDKYEASQLVTQSDGVTPILFNLKEQYSQKFFSKVAKEDIDHRGAVVEVAVELGAEKGDLG